MHRTLHFGRVALFCLLASGAALHGKDPNGMPQKSGWGCLELVFNDIRNVWTCVTGAIGYDNAGKSCHCSPSYPFYCFNNSTNPRTEAYGPYDSGMNCDVYEIDAQGNCSLIETRSNCSIACTNPAGNAEQ